MATEIFYQWKGIERARVRRFLVVVRFAAAAAFVPGAVMLTGCGPAPVSPTVIVVVASATANEPAPELSVADRAMLRHAGSISPDATAFVVNPDTGQAREVLLTPHRADGEVDYGQGRDSKLAANVNRVQQMLNTLAASKPFDLLTMIAQAIRVTSHPGTLLVLSSGLSTAGGFDLRQVSWGAAPRAVADSLRHRDLLPRLTGWNTVFSGLADTAGRQPGLPLPQRTVLTRYWLALCRAAGAASCAVNGVTPPNPPSRSTTPVPVVQFPQVTSYRGPNGGQITNIPADTFFAFDSARLLPGADSVLRPIAAKTRGQHLEVTIRGYASPEAGSRRYNLALSARRAQAVRARLIYLGAPVGLVARAVGLGIDGQPRSACYRRGQLDEAICAQLRRVQITTRRASSSVA